MIQQQQQLQENKRKKARLWIGGTSGLTRTYLNEFIFHNNPKKDYDYDNNNNKATEEQDTSDNNDEYIWILIGQSLNEPDWITNEKMKMKILKTHKDQHNNNMNTKICDSVLYISINLIELDDDEKKKNNNIQLILSQYIIIDIIISIRPQLVTWRNHKQNWEYCHQMLYGLEILLNTIIEYEHQNRNHHYSSSPLTTTKLLIIHISSIAAVDHINKQHLYSLQSMIDPKSIDLIYPYDRFKRRTEELIEEIVNQYNNNTNNQLLDMQYTNLRLGAIFSDTYHCIQCTSLALQMYIGPYLPTLIDCNSSWNISQLIHMIMIQQLLLSNNQTTMTKTQQRPKLRPIYFYSRPLYLKRPIPYGDYLVCYRRAYNVNYIPMLIQYILLKWLFILPFHYMTVILSSSYIGIPPYIQSIDYLLQVTNHEHTFDMSETIKDFPNLINIEETIFDCFQRRRQIIFNQKIE